VETDLRKLREEGADPAAVAVLLRQAVEKIEGAAAAAARPTPLALNTTLAAASGLGEGRHCGWESLERLGWRLRPAELTVVAARPGCGKTTFLSNLVVNMLRDPKAGPVLLVQAELSLWQAHAFLLAPYVARSGQGRWSAGEIIRQLARGNLEEPLAAAAQAFDEKSNGRLYVVTEPLTPEQIAVQAEAIERAHGQPLSLMAIDYLELLQAEGRYDSAELRVSAIADGLLEVAKKARVPVVALSQFNREASEARGGGVEHLRYSDRVGALATTVLSLALPQGEEGGSENEAETELEVTAKKNRYGRKGAQVYLVWERARGLMVDPLLGRGR
jgi:replicative DNA helicase